MKSERRHELQHNELAEWLAKAALAIKPYQNIIFLAVLLILAVLVGNALWSRISAGETEKAWDAVNAALESGQMSNLAGVIETYPGTNAAHMAAVVLADNYLGIGCDQLFTNKASAQDSLNKAIRHYETIRMTGKLPSLVERATYGLARAHEAKGELEPAEKLYEEVAANWPDGAYVRISEQRAADLKKPATKEFYDKFAMFDPQPSFSSPEDKPEFDVSNLPEEGEASTSEPSAEPETEPEAKQEDAEKSGDAVAVPEDKEAKPAE